LKSTPTTRRVPVRLVHVDDAAQALHVPLDVCDLKLQERHQRSTGHTCTAVGPLRAGNQDLWQVITYGMLLLLEAATLLYFYRTSTDASTPTGTVQYRTAQYAYRLPARSRLQIACLDAYSTCTYSTVLHTRWTFSHAVRLPSICPSAVSPSTALSRSIPLPVSALST